MMHKDFVKALGYNTYTVYDEYTPLTKKQFNTMYEKYYKKPKEEKKTLDNVTVKVGNQTYRAREVEFTQSVGEYPEIELSTVLSPYNKLQTPELSIKDIIFNPPATIVFWSDNTKTVVKARSEFYDPEKGIAMAISKKMLGNNKYEYYNIYKHWLKKWNKQSKDNILLKYLEKAMDDAFEKYHDENFDKIHEEIPTIDL
jgi:hypothetical protein